MSLDLILGTLMFNAPGQQFFGQTSTAISLSVTFDDILGYTWHLKNRAAGGAWTQFAMTDPISGQAQRDAYVAAVNNMDMDTFIAYLSPWVSDQIARVFGPWVGPVQLPPRPNPAAGLTNAGNIIDRLSGVLVNDFQFVPTVNGLLGLARK